MYNTIRESQKWSGDAENDAYKGLPLVKRFVQGQTGNTRQYWKLS